MDISIERLLEDTVVRHDSADHYLMVMNGPEDGRVLSLEKDSTTIGRVGDSDIVLALDASISRKHARVLREGDAYFIEDLNSKFGTFVDDVTINRRHLLRDGCLIRLGETLLRFSEK